MEIQYAGRSLGSNPSGGVITKQFEVKENE